MKMLKNDHAWADFFTSRIGLILFASILLLAALRVPQIFEEREAKNYLDSIASGLASKIEAVDTTTIPGYKYYYQFNEKDKEVLIELSTEYVGVKTKLDDREIFHAEAIVAHVYPPNSLWNNSAELRGYLSEKISGTKRNGEITSPLDSSDRGNVSKMFSLIRQELAKKPFLLDRKKPLIIEKIIIYYSLGTKEGLEEEDYVLAYQG
jgi:hypothetical protein